MAIKKDTLHPENEPEVDIYPKTSIDQVENLPANLDALNGDIANVNGEIANISTNITVLNTAYGSYTDYTEVTNGFLLTYLSGKQIELPIKAGTNVTFSKYPGTNQIVINATGGSVPDNIALLDAANTFTAENTFNKITYYNNRVFFQNGPIIIRDTTKKISLSLSYNGFYKNNENTGNAYNYIFPDKTGTLAVTTDIPNTSSFATLAGNNKFSGANTFEADIKILPEEGNFCNIAFDSIYWSVSNILAGFTWDSMEFHLIMNENDLIFPKKSGTLATLSDIPNLTSYPTSIYFNNYSAGISYRDASTGTIKTVVSTDNNGAQIVLGDSNTGLTLATNARPKVLEDSTVKEVAYTTEVNQNKADITYLAVNKADRTDLPNLGNFTFSDNNMNIRGSTVISRSTGSPTEFIFGNYDNTFRTASSGLFTFYNQNAYAVINLADKIGPQNIAFKSDIPNTSSFATLAGNNTWTGQNEFPNGITMYGGSFNTEYTPEGAHVTNGDYRADYGGRWISTEYQGQSGTINIPQGKSGTMALIEDIPSKPQYNIGNSSTNPTTFVFNEGVYHTLTITLLDGYISTSIILPNDYDGSQINIELGGKSFVIMVAAGMLSVRNTTDNSSWVGKLEKSY